MSPELQHYAHKLIKKYLDSTQSKSVQDRTAVQTVKEKVSEYAH